MGARKNFICGAPLASINLTPPAIGSVVRVGSAVAVWNPDLSYWSRAEVIGFREGVASMDGCIIACTGAARFVPWTLIR